MSHSKIVKSLLIISLLVIGVVYPILAKSSQSLFIQVDKGIANDGQEWDQFGASVALDGDTAVVGANGADVGGNNWQGAAYVFIRSGSDWTQQAKLTADDGQAQDQFGVSVAISGDTILVGAVNDAGNGSRRAAYVFTRSGSSWVQQAKLTPENGTEGDHFGTSVTIDGDTALVGATRTHVEGNDWQGATYVFTRFGSSWSQQAKLTADDGQENEFLGNSVSIFGETAVIGAWLANVGPVGSNINRGAAYVFTRSGSSWTQQAKLTADDGQGGAHFGAGDQFGTSVDMDGDTILIGAVFADVGGNDQQGAAYVFTGSGSSWTQQSKLTADDGQELDNFGVSVAVAGDVALVSAIQVDVDGVYNQGAAYIFTRSGNSWTQQDKLTASDGQAQDYFGISVALTNSTAVVGTASANNYQGAVYFFGQSLLDNSIYLPLVTK